MTAHTVFPKGQQVFILPVRYWEDNYTIEVGHVTEQNKIEANNVLVRPEGEPHGMYFQLDRLFFNKDNAEAAKALKIALRDVNNRDSDDFVIKGIIAKLNKDLQR